MKKMLIVLTALLIIGCQQSDNKASDPAANLVVEIDQQKHYVESYVQDLVVDYWQSLDRPGRLEFECSAVSWYDDKYFVGGMFFIDGRMYTYSACVVKSSKAEWEAPIFLITKHTVEDSQSYRHQFREKERFYFGQPIFEDTV